MPRKQTEKLPVLRDNNAERDDEYAALLKLIVANYKLFVESEHPYAAQLLDEFTGLFQKVRRQESILTAFALERQGSK